MEMVLLKKKGDFCCVVYKGIDLMFFFSCFGEFFILLHCVPFSSVFYSFVLIKKRSRFNFVLGVSLPSCK